MITAMSTEIVLRKQFLHEKIQTIYFGGGTPSLLSKEELINLMETISSNFNISETAEVTLEANPDDINEEVLKLWKELGINRLSIGIQSFNDDFLKYLNRSHNAQQAKQSVALAQKYFNDRLNIDLIYSIPHHEHSIWKNDVETAINILPQHISAYNLTIEEKTVFGKWKKKGRIKEVDEDFATFQYQFLIKKLSKAGYEHYEVSNFCLPGSYSLHNTSYWKGKPYLGIGPGAHSYNINQRQYNISSNPFYIKALNQKEIPAETEILSEEDKINEYLITGLRTKWGIDLIYLKYEFGYDLNQRKDYIDKLIASSLAKVEENRLILSEEGFLLADEIALKFAL